MECAFGTANIFHFAPNFIFSMMHFIFGDFVQNILLHQYKRTNHTVLTGDKVKIRKFHVTVILFH